MKRKKHANPDIEAAVQYAEANDWRYVPTGKSGHSWGKLRCPFNDKTCRCGDFCQNSIWSTPSNPSNHAKAIRRWVDACIFKDKKG